MHISTLTKIASTVCIVLSLLTFGLLLMMDHSIQKKRHYTERQMEFRQLGHDLAQASNFLTREARHYTVFGDQYHYDAYWKEVNETKTRDKVVERLTILQAPAEELGLIELAKINSDSLVTIEKEALNAAKQGDFETARVLMFNKDYDHNKSIVMSPIKIFQDTMNNRAEHEAKNAWKKANIYLTLTNVVIFTYIILTLAFLYFVFIRRVSQPLTSITNAMTEISSGNIDTEIPLNNTSSEINELARATELFKISLIKNQKLAEDLQHHKDNLEQDILKRTEELRHKNIELAEKRRIANAANYAKSRFLATMSHEIRTPLNGVVGMSELLLGTTLDDKQKKYATTINSSSDVLLKIIGDILDFSKIEAGEMEINPVSMSLYRHTKEIMSIMSSVAEEHNVEFIFKYDTQIPNTVVLDPIRIKQIILNLVGNAVKFTANGYVIIDIQQVESLDTGDLRLRFEVIDNGIGIPYEKQAEIFENFTQADASTTREYGGTGLGLSICRKLVALMNGTIDVKSEVGKGSTFWFEIVTKEGGAIEQDKAPISQRDTTVEALKGEHVLIVDDFQPNLDVLEGYLSSWNIKCTSVSSGHDALLEIEKAEQDNRPYTIALIDYMMPKMDGKALAKAIRNRPTSAKTKLVMVTAAYKIKDVNRAQSMGFDHCILKPIYASELMDALLELTDHTPQKIKTSEESIVEKITLPNGHRPQILVAEDSRVNQMFAEEILGELGCDIEIAQNGLIAFEYYQKNAYDLVLMDCMMPEMDGYEATCMIREFDNDSNATRIPIIAMTANAMDGDREKCLNAGMDDYIAKPARREDIKIMLKKYLTDLA